MDHRIAAWEIAGIFFIIAAGSLFHFVYSLTGNALAAGIFFPVNESVGEHHRLTFFPPKLPLFMDARTKTHGIQRRL